MSYQHFSYLYYSKIHLSIYISWYFPLAYDDFSSLCFILNCHGTFLFSQILNLFICSIFENDFFSADKSIHCLLFSIINNKCKNQVTVIKQSNHWKRDKYQGLDDCCEGYLDLDLNYLDSGNLQHYTTVLSQCEQMPCTWKWCLIYFDHWYHFEKRPGIFLVC